MNDYIKNGINGKIIKKLIKDLADMRYNKQTELEIYYKKNFVNVEVYKN